MLPDPRSTSKNPMLPFLYMVRSRASRFSLWVSTFSCASSRSASACAILFSVSAISSLMDTSSFSAAPIDTSNFSISLERLCSWLFPCSKACWFCWISSFISVRLFAETGAVLQIIIKINRKAVIHLNFFFIPCSSSTHPGIFS